LDTSNGFVSSGLTIISVPEEVIRSLKKEIFIECDASYKKIHLLQEELLKSRKNLPISVDVLGPKCNLSTLANTSQS